jgi:hypothetical protein
MRMLVRCVVPLALAATAIAPAQAWERFIAGGPNWVQSLAPHGALSTDASGNVCLLSNDRVNGQITNAHVLVLGAQAGDMQPSQMVYSRDELATLGVDCRAGLPVLSYVGIDPDSQRHTWLLAASAANQPPWPPVDLPSIGAVHPSRFGVDNAQTAVVLRQRASGSAYDVQAFHLPMPMPAWQADIPAWRYPSARVLDMIVAADGSTSLLGTFDNQGDPSLGVFVQRFDANGGALQSMDYPDTWFAEVGPAALAPAGTAYYVRRNSQYVQDMLWRVNAQTAAPFPMDLGCCGPLQVKHLAALADDGALVATRAGFAGLGRLSRFAADGSLRWQADLPEVGLPGFEVLGVIGDRAGRALVVSRAPWFDPQQPTRTVTLRALDEQGQMLWTRDVPGVRFDEGQPLRLAVTSDDRVVVALNTTSLSQMASGILVQSFLLSSPTP